MTVFAIWAVVALHCGFVAQRMWTLFFQDQDAGGRVADALIVAFYSAIIIGLWPLLWSASA